MPICIVDKKLLGSSISFWSNLALEFPSSLNFFTFDLFTDTIAISADAKNALTAVSMIINNI